MQFYAIATLGREAKTGNRIEASRVFLHRLLQGDGLLWCRLELYDHRSIHTKSVSYIYRLLSNIGRKARLGADARGTSSPCVNAGVSVSLCDEGEHIAGVYVGGQCHFMGEGYIELP